MTATTPERLRLDGHCLIVLERTLLAAAPEEGCALLIGQQLGSTLALQLIWPCRNHWQPAVQRLRRFSLDPREQLLAQRWCRARGLCVIGAAHSHPISDAVPSSTDQALCVGPTLMVIHTGLQQGLAALRAWWVHAADPGGEQLASPTELAITLGPATAGAEHLGE